MKNKLIITLLLISFTFFAQTGKCISGNCENGKGKLIISEKSYYEGEFVNKQFSGKGTFEDENYLYTGQWKDGSYNGKGKLSSKNQGEYVKINPYYHVYEGEFVNGAKNGQGLLAYFVTKDTSNVYRGNFKENEFFGKGDFHVIPNCVYSSDNWTDSQNFTSGKEVRDDTKEVFTGAYVNLNFRRDKTATTEVTPLKEATREGMFISHSKKKFYLSEGQYSEVFKTDMIGKLANGYKKYSVCIDVDKYAKKYHIPAGVSFFFQLINDKNQVVNQQVKTQYDGCCDFDVIPDGTYTIQIAYDYHTCLGDCEKINPLTLEIQLISYNYIYK